MIPSDPMMLLSYVNLKLRDEYAGLDELCDRLDIDKAELVSKLAAVGYKYNESTNQFH